MLGGRAAADKEGVADRAVRLARHYQPQHIPLAWRESWRGNEGFGNERLGVPQLSHPARVA